MKQKIHWKSSGIGAYFQHLFWMWCPMDPAKEVSFNHVPLSAEHDPALVESICPKCQRSLGTSQLPYMLRIVENAHKCTQEDEEA